MALYSISAEAHNYSLNCAYLFTKTEINEHKGEGISLKYISP